MVNELKEKIVQVPIDSIKLEGSLKLPQKSKGIVIFAHGSGSSRHSSRNNFVANVLQENGFGTLLFDLLTEKEDTKYENRFNIHLLSDRLNTATNWLIKELELKEAKIGYFGASTGAAAALFSAYNLKDKIHAVVSRGGRPDLAKEVLKNVQAPTLLIVGGNDDVVIKLNKEAYELIKAEKELSIVPGASHLFEEKGALEKVANLAAAWFRKHLMT